MIRELCLKTLPDTTEEDIGKVAEIRELSVSLRYSHSCRPFRAGHHLFCVLSLH